MLLITLFFIAFAEFGPLKIDDTFAQQSWAMARFKKQWQNSRNPALWFYDSSTIMLTGCSPQTCSKCPGIPNTCDPTADTAQSGNSQSSSGQTGNTQSVTTQGGGATMTGAGQGTVMAGNGQGTVMAGNGQGAMMAGNSGSMFSNMMTGFQNAAMLEAMDIELPEIPEMEFKNGVFPQTIMQMFPNFFGTTSMNGQQPQQGYQFFHSVPAYNYFANNGMSVQLRRPRYPYRQNYEVHVPEFYHQRPIVPISRRLRRPYYG